MKNNEMLAMLSGIVVAVTLALVLPESTNVGVIVAVSMFCGQLVTSLLKKNCLRPA